MKGCVPQIQVLNIVVSYSVSLLVFIEVLASHFVHLEKRTPDSTIETHS